MRVEVFAHRGDSSAYPENTMAAFGHALELGSDGMELDVQLTSDGALVVVHDETFQRTAGDPRRVWEVPLEEVRRLDAGGWFDPRFRGERIPTLEEVLDRFGGRLLVQIEMKAGGWAPGALEPKLASMIAGRRWFDAVAVSSFDWEMIRRLRALAPEARLGVLLADDGQWEEAWALAREVRAEAVHPHRRATSAERVARSHQAGLRVRTYTVDTEEEMRRFVALGVDGLFTNVPSRLLALR